MFTPCVGKIVGNSCFLSKLCSNGRVLKNSFSTTSNKWNKFEVLNNLEVQRQAVLKSYNQPSHEKRDKFNYIAVKLYLMREVGIDPELLADLAKDTPEVYECGVDQMKDWMKLLLQYSFERDEIVKLIQNYPWLLLISASQIAKKFYDLLQHIEISRSEIPLLCYNAPSVLADDINMTIEKHLYLHFIMSHRDFSEAVSSGVFNFSVKHIKERHQFLHRRGQYFKLNRHGSSKIQNPSLADIFCTNEEKFCEVANCDLKEYKLFQKLFKIEMMVEEKSARDIGGDTNTFESDFDDDDDDLEANSLANELSKHL